MPPTIEANTAIAAMRTSSSGEMAASEASMDSSMPPSCPAGTNCANPGYDFAACAVFRSAGEISTPKRSHQMMTLGYFARSTPAGMA